MDDEWNFWLWNRELEWGCSCIQATFEVWTQTVHYIAHWSILLVIICVNLWKLKFLMWHLSQVLKMLDLWWHEIPTILKLDEIATSTFSVLLFRTATLHCWKIKWYALLWHRGKEFLFSFCFLVNDDMLQKFLKHHLTNSACPT